MEQTDTGIPFVQPLAELAVRGHDGDSTHTFTLCLTSATLTLIPSPEAAADLAGGAGDAGSGLAQAPAIIRWVVARMLGTGPAGLPGAFTPHPLRETTVTLAGPYLHVRLGPLDVEYGPDEFDPAAATAFAQEYERACAHVGES